MRFFSRWEYATNRFTIINQQHSKVSRDSGSFYLQGENIISSTLSQVFYFLTSRLSTNHKSIKQASDILSISEQYKSHNSSTLWYSINFRALSSPAFIKHMMFYQFQIIIKPRIQQAYDILSISEQYTAQHSSRIWSSINLRASSTPALNKPLIFYKFESNI